MKDFQDRTFSTTTTFLLWSQNIL